MNAYSQSNASGNWNDFNDAEAQHGAFDLIPKGTIVPLRMSIKPGGHDDHSQGWTNGYATQSFDTGAVYLSCEFVVTTGPFAKRKMWSNIGLQSAKGPTWGQMGRSFIRAALNSARNVNPLDNSPQAALHAGSTALPIWTASSSLPGSMWRRTTRAKTAMWSRLPSSLTTRTMRH